MTFFGDSLMRFSTAFGVSLDQMVVGIVCTIILVSVLLIAKAQYHPIKPEKKQNIAKSRKLLQRIQRCDDNAVRMKLMRDTHPHVFEELLLTAMKSPIRKIRRNRRYTGDGGLDGKVKINGRWHLIQAKRYGANNHINPEHVSDFIKLCRAHQSPGLFIHTGKTGDKSRELIANADNCLMISGQSLCALVGGDISIESLLNQDL